MIQNVRIWDNWKSHMASDSSEDLADVFTRVRLQRGKSIRASWARDPSTRAFCDLALHMLYRNTIEYTGKRPISCKANLAPVVSGDDLERHAAEMIDDQDRLASLTADRWRQTWE